MSDQMALLPTTLLRTDPATPAQGGGEANVSWDLDDHTRELGRRGLAAARRALAQGATRLAA